MAVNLELPLADLSGHDLGSFPGGPWGWSGAVPLPDRTDVVTLGEGNTPLIRLPSRTGRPGVWLKNVVVAIGTSTGLKDLDLALRGAELPVLDEGVTDLQDLLQRT